MKTKIFFMVMIFALAATMLFVAGCAKKGEETAADDGTPKYGGTLTHLTAYTNSEPPDWDPVLAAGPAVIVWSAPVMEQALEGDILKFGPRGTNEYGFTNPYWVDEPYYKGNTVESWTWTDPLTLTFKLRKGIKFSGKSVNSGVMKAREFVAGDFVYHIKRMQTSANKGQLWNWIADTTAPDDYTWVVNFKEYYADWTWWLASAFVQVYPKEVVDAGASDWKNLVGTGPFLITDYVRGSQATYERNEDYWGKTTINGKEYQTPFIDKMIWPVIADESTQIASLRTGKIDWAEAVSPRYNDTLTQTSADLKKYPYLLSGSLVVALQTSQSPIFKNEAVRRALMIGTDLETIGKNAWGAGNYDINPLVKGSALYTPIADMPESTKELFAYDVEKAKKMLADAGYAKGFEMEMTYAPSQTNFQAEDIASMIVDMWSKLGVKVKLNPVEQPVLTNLVYGHTYKDSLLCGRGYGTGGVFMAMGVKGHEENTADWESAEFTEAYNKAFSERDPIKSLAIKKEMAIQLLDAVPMLPTPVFGVVSYAWPWVKNYAGEISGGFTHFNPMSKIMWIDQALKTKMGF